jgi:hypothetical protein
MPRLIISGRSTGRGAFTSANGRRVNVSRTGNHWQEIIEGPIGQEFVITDISNSGKHFCRRVRITGDNTYDVVEPCDEYDCQFCRNAA